MKTLVLSSDDILKFGKTFCNTNLSDQTNNNTLDSAPKSNPNLMALHYYLKLPNNYIASTQGKLEQPQESIPGQSQQLLMQSQTQLKHLQLKQPKVYQQHNIYHHHPYYQQTITPAHSHTQILTPTHSHSYSQTQAVPVYALNQNSNFSAASSSTGGTASSHAPTQQSNTTNSSFSPPCASANARTTQVSGTQMSNTVAKGQTRNSNVSAKKLKTEPILTESHQTERLSFANTYVVWNEEHWKRVVFQDERKFNLDGPDGFSFYFHDLRNYERTLSQRPRGNFVYVYLLVTVGGPIHLEISTAKMKPESCIETVLRERSNIIAKLGGKEDFLLQDHNWMVNTLATTQQWLNAEGIRTQKWPTISHDLNIMENIWGWLIREVYDGGRKFSRKDELVFRIREAWSRLPLDLLINLYSTMPERMSELYYTRAISPQMLPKIATSSFRCECVERLGDKTEIKFHCYF